MADATQAAGEHWITALAALPPGEALTVGEFCAQTGIGVRLARQSLNRLLGAAKVTESIRFGGGRGQPPKAYSLKGTR